MYQQKITVRLIFLLLLTNKNTYRIFRQLHSVDERGLKPETFVLMLLKYVSSFSYLIEEIISPSSTHVSKGLFCSINIT
jgi:hypothetical protein